jgi:ABC-2 type transport system ATP-binding protein
MTTNAVETRGLSKRYGRDIALDRVDMIVPEGAVYVLAGANGAGKSTTFKILMNLERPSSGTASVFGHDIASADTRAQIGYVPERQESPYSWMTCSQLLDHAAAFYPSWDASYAAHLENALQVRAEHKTGTLSKGEMRRVQLVMAMAHRPPLLLLDEPTEGLDPLARRQLLTLVAEHLADCPTTIVISTHHVHEVETLADYVGVLRSGRLAAQMNRDDLQRNINLYELELPPDWKAPEGLNATPIRTSSSNSDAQWTIIGDESQITQRLNNSGAHVRHKKSVNFDDAVVALLSAEVAR